MALKFTDAIIEVEKAPVEPAEFLKWLREHAPQFADSIEKDFGKNLSVGDVHQPTALGNDKKSKPVSVGYVQDEEEETEKLNPLTGHLLEPGGRGPDGMGTEPRSGAMQPTRKLDAGWKIDRSAFLYFDGNGKKDFAQCGSCCMFDRDSKMCTPLDHVVKAEWSCGVYIPGEFDKSTSAARLTDEEAGLYKGSVRCENCFYGGDDCQLYIMLNKAKPDVFDLDTKIESLGCCNAFTPPEGQVAKTIDTDNSANASFDYWMDELKKANGDVEKLKIKHKSKITIEATPAEMEALKDKTKTGPTTFQDWIDRALAQQAVAKQSRTVRVVRHGATHLNNNDTSVDRIRGWKNVPLSEEGREEAKKTAEKMAKDPPDAIVSSDLKRAHETAKYIAKACNCDINEVSSAFRPWDVGKYAGATSKDAVPILADYAVNKPDEKLPPGSTSPGESFNSFRQRFMTGLSDALEKYQGVLAVVTHHRGERLLAAWKAAGFPADGTIDGKEFTKKGEGTAGFDDMEIPVDKLKSAAAAKVAKWINVPDDLSKIWESNDELPSSLDGLPDHAKTVFRQVANDRIKAGHGETSAIRQAWSAVKNGWRKQGDQWVRKADDDWELPVEVLKTEPDKQMIFGWASISTEGGQPIIDKQNDVIMPEDLEKAAYDFVLYSRSQGDMHNRRGVGRLIESAVFTKDKQDALGISLGTEGWWVGFKVDDPEVWKAIKSGERQEFSIGGQGERKDIDENPINGPKVSP